jgi:hypothetical protein
MSDSSTKSLLWIGAAIAATAALIWIHQIYIERPQGKNWFSSDLIRYFYPVTAFLGAELGRGEFPLWNPHQLAGVPFVALHTPAALYPPNLVAIFALPTARAMEAHALLHMWIVGFFSALYARRLGLHLAACLAIGGAMLLADTYLSRVYNMAIFSTVAWLPGLFWALHGLLEKARWRDTMALTGIVALAFLGGFSQGFLYEMQVAGAYAVFGVFVITPVDRRLRAMTLGAVAVTAGMLVCAAQLLPTLEIVRQGTRTLEGIPYSSALHPGLHRGFNPGDLIAGLSGSTQWLGEDDVRGGALGWPMLAVLTLPLALIAALHRPLRSHWVFFAGLATLVGLFMLGDATPVFKLYYSLPGGSVFRVPTRAAFLYSFAMIMLTGFGIHAAFALLSRTQRLNHHAATITIVLAVAVFCDFFGHATLPHAFPTIQTEKPSAPANVLRFIDRRDDHARVFMEDGGRLLNREFQYKAGMIHGLDVVPDYEPLLPDGYRLYFDQPPMWHGRLNLVHLEPRPIPEGLLDQLDRMSVRYYVTPTGNVFLSKALRRQLDGADEYRVGGDLIFERKSALPRAYAVHEAIAVADDEAARARMLEENFDPRVMAVVNGDPLELGPAPKAAPPKVEIRRHENSEVEIHARCGAPCLVVLTDLDYPGWEVQVDDEPGEIERVNGLFRGVRIEAGTHRISYRYRPGAFRWGLAISGTTVGALLFTSWWMRDRYRWPD